MKKYLITICLLGAAASTTMAATSSKSLSMYTCKVTMGDGSAGVDEFISASSEIRAVELAMSKYKFDSEKNLFRTDGGCIVDTDADDIAFCNIQEIICEEKSQ